MTNNESEKRSPAPFGFRFIAPLALGARLNPINSTMISTALVPIAVSLHASVAETGWLIAGLYLTSAVAQPTMGRLPDLFGPRRIFLISLFFVAAAGVVGQLASSLTSLVMARVLLGIGTSAAYPAAMRIFRVQADLIGCQPSRVAMGVLSLAGVSTVAVGPLICSVLTSAFGWHSIFTLNVPLALLTVLLILLWVPKDQPRVASFARLLEEVDLTGIGLFATFLLSLMAVLMNLDRPVWLALLAAAVFGAALVVHSRRRRQPFIDVRMVARNRPLTVTSLRTTAVLIIVYSVLYGFAQWLESAVGFSSAKAGLVTLPMSVVAAISSVTGVRTKGLRAPFVVSTGAALAGSICLFLVDSRTSVWIIATAVMFFGYIGAIAAASLLALMYGQHATDHGLHSLAAVMGVLSAFLFVATLFDRTIPRVPSAAVPESDATIATP